MYTYMYKKNTQSHIEALFMYFLIKNKCNDVLKYVWVFIIDLDKIKFFIYYFIQLTIKCLFFMV